MSRKLFGTDGVRGVANRDLTPELVFSLGAAAGHQTRTKGWVPNVAIGQDTRRSGEMLASALAAGFCSVGVSVTRLGVVPTGMVSKVAQKPEVGMGAVVSASHNPAPDNGVKLIAHDGRKLSDEDESAIEILMGQPVEERPIAGDVGVVEYGHQRYTEDYLQQLEALVPERLDGMRIAVDGANGAAFELGPEILRRLGADLITTAVEPDGMNINQGCGATHPETIERLTVEAEAEVGIAFDGDADRAVFSDGEGRLINGDRTMAIWCAHWKVVPPVVVGTVMSNSGFERYMGECGIHLERAAVGDKHVARRMTETGAKIGGEQSGHLIFSERGVTGDGLITALEFLRVIRREGRTATSFMSDFESMPQLLVNLKLPTKDAALDSEAIQQALEASKRLIEGKGRLNLRPSGTQPMVRLMVEAETAALRDEAAQNIVQAFQRELQATIYSQVDLTYALGD